MRLLEIYKYKGFTKYIEFADKTGLSHQVASNYLKGVRKPNSEGLEKIILSFDDVDADWLLTGRGEMLKSNSISILNEPELKYYTSDKEEIKFLKEQIKRKDKEIDRLWLMISPNENSKRSS